MKYWLPALGLLVLTSAGANAQTDDPGTAYVLNLHGGGLFNEDFEVPLVGARFRVVPGKTWSWGGNFDWARIGDRDEPLAPGLPSRNLDFFLYSFEVEYAWLPGRRVRPFAGIGLGATTTRVQGDPIDARTATGPLIPVAVGVKIFDRETDPTWFFRIDFRDNLVNAGEKQSLASNDINRTHNFELSAGVSFILGR